MLIKTYSPSSISNNSRRPAVPSVSDNSGPPVIPKYTGQFSTTDRASSDYFRTAHSTILFGRIISSRPSEPDIEAERTTALIFVMFSLMFDVKILGMKDGQGAS